MYEIIKRKSWRRDARRYVPHATPGRRVRTVETEAEARAICAEANKNRPAYGTSGYFNFTYTEYRSA
jgi:hypothetical protein